MRPAIDQIKVGIATLTLSFVVTTDLFAGPHEDATAAYKRGDHAGAISILRPLADQGDALAQLKLGFTYEQDLKNLAEAMKWFRKAADQGNGLAQLSVASLYRNGQGVERNYAEAVKWYRLAAEQSDSVAVRAQYSLGYIYFKGEGVQQNYSEAMKWFRRAAERGAGDAQLSLGVMYANGAGVPQDFVSAHMWFNLAAAWASADTSHRDLEIRNRDQVAGKMTPAQVAEAQRLAREWKSK